jgi:hypothetical protein
MRFANKEQMDVYFGGITTDIDGPTITFDMSVTNKHQVTLGGNRTLAVANVSSGQGFLLALIQDGTGTRTVTWFSNIKWASGTTPVLSTTPGKTDLFSFINWNGTYLGMSVLNF